MKVLHIVPSYFPALQYGGPIHSVYLLNNSIAKNGVAVDVITCNVGLRNRQDIPEGKWIPLEGTRVMYLPYYGYEHFTFSPQLLWHAVRNAKKYDIVHITAVWNFPVFAGSLSSFFAKTPYVISPRGTIYKETIELKSKNKKKFYYYLLAQHYLKRAASMHFTTEDEREKVTSFLNLKTPSFVVPNGLDLSEFKDMPSKGFFKEKFPILKNKRYILFLSRVHPKKGLDILIDAFAKIDDDVFLVIAGPDHDNYTQKLQQQIHNHNIQSKVIFTGMLTGQDKLAAFQDADWSILPSYSENFGMVVVESLACGTPVIISNQVGLYHEIEKYKAGIIVNADTNSVLEGIRTAINDNQNRERMVHNGRKLVQEFYDITPVGKNMISEYSKLLRKQK